MNTKGTIKINVEGASLTEAEKEEILRMIADQLNRNEKVVNINDYRKPEEKKERLKGLKDGIGNFGRNAADKIGNLSPQEVLAWASALLMATKGSIAVSQEVRLIRKEHRLQKEAKRRAK